MKYSKSDRDRCSAWKYSEADFDTIPSKRTVSEKFKVQAYKAGFKLSEIGLFSDDDRESFITGPLLTLSQNPGSFNGAAFALVYTCFDIYTKRFNPENWNNLVRLIQKADYRKTQLKLHATDFESFLIEFGINVDDLIRYYIYAYDLERSRST